jgi:uncharacterized protein YkwD
MPVTASRPAPRRARHHAVLAIAALLAGGALGSGPASVAAADLSIPAAEQQMLTLVNAERAKAGLVALRIDSRLASIARARSTDMATRHYFSHTQPDGRKVFDYLTANRIKWYAAGEIIAWNDWPGLDDSAVRARNDWMGSRTHRAIILSANYNYVGFGVAFEASTGRWLWTGVFMKGPDRTGGWVRFGPVGEPDVAAAARYRTVSINWQGGDIRLSILTAGLRHYQTQVRTDGGAWSWLSTGTTITRRSLRLWDGHVYDFRARACDRVGNCSSWYNLRLEG